MMSAKISDFFTPTLVRKFTQTPLLRLLTMSAFEGTCTPLSADVINGSPLIEVTTFVLRNHAERSVLGTVHSVSPHR